MGEVEKRQVVRERRNKIRRIALSTVQTAGLIALTIAVPNALQGFAKLGLLPGPRHKESLKRSYQRLLQKGFLKFEGNRLSLTAKGERELHRLELQTALTKTRRWDRKWRVLIFDIPERKRRVRDTVRTTLQAIGFVRLQDSVWIYPFDCEDLVTLLKADLRIGYEMRYIIADQLEGDAALRKQFRL